MSTYSAETGLWGVEEPTDGGFCTYWFETEQEANDFESGQSGARGCCG